MVKVQKWIPVGKHKSPDELEQDEGEDEEAKLPQDTHGQNNNLNGRARSDREDGKILVTGDDVLIEYVSRLIKALRGSNEERINRDDRSAIEKFVSHYVWHSQDLNKHE